MAVLLSTVEVNAMSLKNALQSKELSLDFDRGGTIWCGYTNTDNKVPVNKKDYLFDKNTFFIDMSTLHISTNTVKLGSNNIPSILASIKGNCNISLQYLPSNNRILNSISFSGNNSNYNGTLYLPSEINNITFTNKKSVISNIGIPSIIPNKGKNKESKHFALQQRIKMVNMYLPNNSKFGTLNVDGRFKLCLMHKNNTPIHLSFAEIKNPNNALFISSKVQVSISKNNNNNKTLRNINITDCSNISLQPGNISSNVININKPTNINKLTYEFTLKKNKEELKSTKKTTLKQTAKDSYDISSLNISGLDNITLVNICDLLDSLQEAGNKQEILSNIINNINKMNTDTLSNINTMDGGTLYHLCNVLGKLLLDKVTKEILFNISKMDGGALCWLSNVLGKLPSDKITTEILSNISKMDGGTLCWLSDVLGKLLSNKVTTEIFSNISKMDGETLYWLSDVLSKLPSDKIDMLYNTLNNQTNNIDDDLVVDSNNDLQSQINEKNNKISKMKACEEGGQIVPFQNKIDLMKSSTDMQNAIKDIIYKNIVMTATSYLTFKTDHVDARKRLWRLCCYTCKKPICIFEACTKTYNRNIPTIEYNGTIRDLMAQANSFHDANCTCNKFHLGVEPITTKNKKAYKEYISTHNCVYTGKWSSGYCGTYDLYCNNCGYHKKIDHGEGKLLDSGQEILNKFKENNNNLEICTKCKTTFYDNTFANTIKQATIDFYPFEHKFAYCNFKTHSYSCICIIRNCYPIEKGYPNFTNNPEDYIQSIKKYYIGKTCTGGIQYWDETTPEDGCGARWVNAIYYGQDHKFHYINVDDCCIQSE